MSLTSEKQIVYEKDGKLFFTLPECPRCKKRIPASAFGFKWYTEKSGGGITFLEAGFFCIRCGVNVKVPLTDIDKLNSWEIRQIEFPTDITKLPLTKRDYPLQ